MRKVPEGWMVKPPLTAAEVRVIKSRAKQNKITVRDYVARMLRDGIARDIRIVLEGGK